MEIHKKILLILTIIVSSIILYRLWRKRIDIKTEVDIPDPSPKIEGFTSKELMGTNNNQFALNQYFVKASWNTAYTGMRNSKYRSNTMDVSMVIDVIESGCRFLDFEIYSFSVTKGKSSTKSIPTTNIIPIVGFSNQVNNNYQMECNEPVVKLEKVLYAISTKAFSMTSNKDPLFIQLRVKSANIELYKSLITVLKNALSPTILDKRYFLSELKNVQSRDEFMNTLLSRQKLSDLNDKVYLFADLVNSDPMFTRILTKGFGEVVGVTDQSPIDDTKNEYIDLIKDYQSIFSLFTTKKLTTSTLSNLSNSRVLSLPSKPYDTDASDNIIFVLYQNVSMDWVYHQSYPDFSMFNLFNLEKLSVYNLVINHAINILPFRFYIDDNNLADYEKMFKVNGSAFIKMETIIRKHSDELVKGLYGQNSQIMLIPSIQQ